MWTTPDGIDVRVAVLKHHLREASVTEATTIGVDIAKHVFHAHGADAAGRAVFSRRLTRGKLLDFFVRHPRFLVALEACGGAHHWHVSFARWVTRSG